jgi:histone H3/H4
VAEVAKELGRLWGQLGEAEKAGYKEKSAALAVAAAAGDCEPADGEQEPQAEGAADTVLKRAPPAGFPHSVVKRIIALDPDVQRVSHDAVTLISQACEMFLASMAEKCARVAAAAKPKRSTVKVCVPIEHAM